MFGRSQQHHVYEPVETSLVFMFKTRHTPRSSEQHLSPNPHSSPRQDRRLKSRSATPPHSSLFDGHGACLKARWSGKHDEGNGGFVPLVEPLKEDDHQGGSAGGSGCCACFSSSSWVLASGGAINPSSNMACRRVMELCSLSSSTPWARCSRPQSRIRRILSGLFFSSWLQLAPPWSGNMISMVAFTRGSCMFLLRVIGIYLTQLCSSSYYYLQLLIIGTGIHPLT